jgi:hypothetical protein
MATSARFRALASRVEDLERRLVPKAKISGKYTTQEKDLLRAYRLLVHAEFEAYFEDRVKEIADLALDAFKKRNRASGSLAALMAFSPLSPQAMPSSLAPKVPYETAKTRVHHVVAHFKAAVSEGNNGIKEVNVIQMCYPIGIVEADLDRTFMNTLNSYGTSRGFTAHQSFRTQQPIDPVTEVAVVNQLVAELGKLDLRFQALRKQR